MPLNLNEVDINHPIQHPEWMNIVHQHMQDWVQVNLHQNPVGVHEVIPINQIEEQEFNELNLDDLDLEEPLEANEAIQIDINNIPKSRKYRKSSKVDFDERSMIIRTILSKDRRRIYHIQYPKDFIGSDEEILDNMMNGIPLFYDIFSLPKKDIKDSKKKLKLNLQVKHPSLKKEVKLEDSSMEEFYEKTNKYFTLLPKAEKYKGDFGSNNDVNFVATIKADKGMCEPCVYVAGKNSDGKYIRGITTGVFNQNDYTVEVIGCVINYKPFNPSYGIYNAPYEKSCKLKKYYIPYKGLHYMKSNRVFDYCRLKIINYEVSSIFGFKPLKKKLVGEVFTPDKFKVIRGFKSVKLNKVIDVVEIVTKNGKVKFAFDDVDFYYLNKEDFTSAGTKSKKEIEVGCKCKVKDNRRTTFDKNDIVVVKTIIKNPSNYRNSIVKVLKIGDIKVQEIFLKQLKRYNETK